MPPNVIEGITNNHKEMIQNMKEIIKGTFTIKNTNNSTILFVEEAED